MGNILFRGSNAPGIFTDQDIFHPPGEFQMYLIAYLFPFNDIHRDIGVDDTENVEVDGDGIVDFDDILPAHTVGEGIYHKGHRVGELVKPKPVENLDTLSGFNVIDDDSIPYLRDVQHRYMLITKLMEMIPLQGHAKPRFNVVLQV
jgi:hypothetical protein